MNFGKPSNIKPRQIRTVVNRKETSFSKLTDDGPRLVLSTEVIDASSYACLLGVTFTPDLCLEKSALIVSGRCFFQLRQLRRIRRSLDSEAVSTILHSFVFSRVDYCNCLMAEAPKNGTVKLHRVMNPATRILTQTKSTAVADLDTP